MTTRKRAPRPGGDIVEQVAEAFDIGVVEGRVDFVEDAERRRAGAEHREQKRQRRERLFAARQ